MSVPIPIGSFPLVTGRDPLYAIRSMRSVEDKTINGIGSRPKRPVCVCMQIAGGGRARLQQMTVDDKKQGFGTVYSHLYRFVG